MRRPKLPDCCCSTQFDVTTVDGNCHDLAGDRFGGVEGETRQVGGHLDDQTIGTSRNNEAAIKAEYVCW